MPEDVGHSSKLHKVQNFRMILSEIFAFHVGVEDHQLHLPDGMGMNMVDRKHVTTVGVNVVRSHHNFRQITGKLSAVLNNSVAAKLVYAVLDRHLLEHFDFRTVSSERQGEPKELQLRPC